MKPVKQFGQVSRRFYRPEQRHCPVCEKRLRRAVTLSERTVITLEEVIKLVHAGYRCPDPDCAGSQRTYRSVQADALALPWFTYGLDIVLLVGQLRLREHQTVDEIHQEVLKRLAPLGVKIARREILYLFEAYCTLLRASSEAKDDREWLAQVEKNGGIIVSLDGIQEDEGQRDRLSSARCSQRAGAGSRERDLFGDGSNESSACPGRRLRSQSARNDHRRPGK
jgi:hypothetical protein